ncbi:CopG family transcriptional regulator [Halothece sp. PCC 7418]|uniref:ribbon-helix-helix domain-containing protein n=1 Tax=Halothece sp. (strain PCC 7418) TaxID=65093 RepID=UPI0002F5A911|nr:CopG family transcriptional regulator [Halothece sp. PCC 7418]
MSDKQKVTLYLPPDVHRNLKIKAATGGESMSGLVEQAVVFYLNHSEVVEEVEQQEHGQTYRLYECPQCESPLIMQDGELTPLESQPTVKTEDIATEQVSQQVKTADTDQSQDQEQLVPC